MKCKFCKKEIKSHAFGVHEQELLCLKCFMEEYLLDPYEYEIKLKERYKEVKKHGKKIKM